MRSSINRYFAGKNLMRQFTCIKGPMLGSARRRFENAPTPQGGKLSTFPSDTDGKPPSVDPLSGALIDILSGQSAKEVANRLKDCVSSLTHGDVTVSLRDGAHLVVAASTDHGSQKTEFYRSGTTTKPHINHTLDKSILVVHLTQDEEVAGRIEAVVYRSISQETISAIESLATAAAVRVSQIQSAERLEALVSSEREFLDRFAHDMKTPLTAILGMAQTLRRQHKLTPEIRAEFLERIEASSRDLERIIEEGRARLKAQSAALSVSLEECDLHALLAKAVEHPRDGKTVTIESFPGPLHVIANSQLLGTVLETVIEHSLARAEKSVRIELSRSGEWTEVYIYDDGRLPENGFYDENIWFRGRASAIGDSPGDPLQLVEPARNLRIMGGKMTFETRHGNFGVILILPLAMVVDAGD